MRSSRLPRTLVLAACTLALLGCSQRSLSSEGAKESSAAVEAAVGSSPAGVVGIARPAVEPPSGEVTGGVDGTGRTAVAAAVAQLVKDGGDPTSDLSGTVAGSAENAGEVWVRVIVKSARAGREPEQVFLSRKSAGGEWVVRTYGTGNGPDDLVSLYGLPPKVAQALFAR